MGIKSLNKFLAQNCPSAVEWIHISEYRYKKIAVDMSLYIHLTKKTFGNPDRPHDVRAWLPAFVRFIASLREHKIHCVFVFDSKPSDDKELEKQKRRRNRDKQEDTVFRLEEALERYHTHGQTDPILVEYSKKKGPSKSLLRSKIIINVKAIESHVKNMRRQLIPVTQNDFDVTKQILTFLKIPYFNAPVEAETACAHLCKEGKVDAVLSRDSDVLAYGAPVFLKDFLPSKGVCKRIKYENVLTELGLTSDQFLDLCILCGTDYNDNIFRVGPATAYKLISAHKSIEKIDQETAHDITILNHNRVRELFREYERVNWDIPYCGRPDFDELAIFFEKKWIRMDMDVLRKSFGASIVFE